MAQPTDWFRISYSSMNLFDSCPRKFEFNKLFPRRARDYDTFAADVGKAMHQGYQTFLMTQSEDKALWAMMQAYPYDSEWNQANDFRSLEACTVTLEAMIESDVMQEWAVAEIRKGDGTVVPAIEVPFELRMNGLTMPDGRGIAVTGFVDAFMRSLINDGQYRTLDIKTNRSFARDKTAKYKFDNQQVPYGIILEHIQGRAIESFEVMYLDTVIDLAEPKVEDYTFTKTQGHVQEWLMNTVLRCQRIVQYAEMDYFPRTDGGCFAWNKPCFFLDVCETRDRKAVESWLLEGEAPEQSALDEPWIIAELDVYGPDGAGGDDREAEETPEHG